VGHTSKKKKKAQIEDSLLLN